VLPTPGGGFAVRVRGTAGLPGYREPLYVVDGQAVEVLPGRGIDWLDPADIARIEVLKDAAELTYYGGRGANGVVVITTKRSRAARPR
jgi:TonB-dependent SusC/RagA subfamily outer membrane receptor